MKEVRKKSPHNKFTLFATNTVFFGFTFVLLPIHCMCKSVKTKIGTCVTFMLTAI